MLDINWHSIALAPPKGRTETGATYPLGAVQVTDKIRHVSFNADDLDRARAFYEAALGWRLEPWGPPDYYQAFHEDQILALHARRELKPGARMVGAEITFSVKDLDASIAAIEGAGGRLVSRPFYIEGVGRLVYFEDTEGNIAGAMQYDRDSQA